MATVTDGSPKEMGICNSSQYWHLLEPLISSYALWMCVPKHYFDDYKTSDLHYFNFKLTVSWWHQHSQLYQTFWTANILIILLKKVKLLIKLLITQMSLEHLKQVILKLHLHSPLNTRLQQIAQRQLQDDRRNIWVLGLGVPYIRDWMVYPIYNSYTGYIHHVLMIIYKARPLPVEVW